MLIGVTNFNVVQSTQAKEGHYQIKLYKPFLDKKYRLFKMLIVMRSEQSEKGILFTLMGHGGNKFQALSFALFLLREKLDQTFDKADLFSYPQEQKLFDLEHLKNSLLTDDLDSNYVIRSRRKLRGKIAELELYPRLQQESFSLDLVVAQPYIDSGQWWCPFQIFPNEPQAVSGQDSFKSLRRAYSIIANWLISNLDNSWTLGYWQQGKFVERNLEVVLELFFLGCKPKVKRVLLEDAFSKMSKRYRLDDLDWFEIFNRHDVANIVSTTEKYRYFKAIVQIEDACLQCQSEEELGTLICDEMQMLYGELSRQKCSELTAELWQKLLNSPAKRMEQT